TARARPGSPRTRQPTHTWRRKRKPLVSNSSWAAAPNRSPFVTSVYTVEHQEEIRSDLHGRTCTRMSCRVDLMEARWRSYFDDSHLHHCVLAVGPRALLKARLTAE